MGATDHTDHITDAQTPDLVHFRQYYPGTQDSKCAQPTSAVLSNISAWVWPVECLIFLLTLKQ